MRSVWPSMIGLRPSGASRIALSTAPTLALSQTLTASMRASGRADRGHLVERRGCAVGHHVDRIEQVDRSAAGAQAAELGLQRGERAVHALLERLEVECLGHVLFPLLLLAAADGGADALPGRAPWRAPPLSRMRNTTIGMLFSLSRLMAVASITFSSFASTSM